MPNSGMAIVVTGLLLAFTVFCPASFAGDRNQALLEATRKGGLQLVQELLEKGADINAHDPNGKTALIVAVERGDLAVVKLLLRKGADTNAVDRDGNTALVRAYKRDALEIIEFLKDYGAKPLLTVAAIRGDVDAVRRLISEGADVNEKDKEGRTALMAAVEQGKLELASLLLDQGADVNLQPNDRWTALELAINEKHEKIEDLLRAHGAQTEEEKQIAKFADKVCRRGDELFFRLKDGTVVSRKNSPREDESSQGHCDSTGEANAWYKFKDFIDPWYTVGVQDPTKAQVPISSTEMPGQQ